VTSTVGSQVGSAEADVVEAPTPSEASKTATSEVRNSRREPAITFPSFMTSRHVAVLAR
jgi:hypothetical protein